MIKLHHKRVNLDPAHLCSISKMRLNRTLMKRSNKLCVCIRYYPAAVVRLNHKPANSAVLKKRQQNKALLCYHLWCRYQIRGPDCPPRANPRQYCLLCLLLELRRAAVLEPNDTTPLFLGEIFAKLRPVRSCSDWRNTPCFRCPFVILFALHSKIDSMRLSSTVFAGQNAREWLLASCLIGPRPCLLAPWRRPRSNYGKLSACHRVDHPHCPHHRSGGRRRPHSCTALTFATRHFSRFPFAWRRRFRHCSDSVCNTLTLQEMVAPHASRSRGAGNIAVTSGQVQREARCCGRLICRSRYRHVGRLGHHSCSSHWAPLPPSERSLVS